MPLNWTGNKGRRQWQRKWKRKMVFGCWNVRELITKCTEVFRTLQQYELDLVVLSETKKGSGK